MITVLSSPKPGSGTSTTVALLTLAAGNDAPTTEMDLCGDRPAIFNCAAAATLQTRSWPERALGYDPDNAANAANS